MVSVAKLKMSEKVIDVVRCSLFVLFSMGLLVTAIIVGIAYRPYSFYPRVDSAVLADFNHIATPPPDSTHALRYNLSVDLSFRNSHRHVKIRYLDMAVSAFYGDFLLGAPDRTFPTPYSQGPNNTVELRAWFKSTVAVFPGVASEVKRDQAAGTVHLRVRVSMELKYTVWGIKRIAHFYRYDCQMLFQLPSDAAPAVFDAGTQCWPVK